MLALTISSFKALGSPLILSLFFFVFFCMRKLQLTLAKNSLSLKRDHASWLDSFPLLSMDRVFKHRLGVCFLFYFRVLTASPSLTSLWSTNYRKASHAKIAALFFPLRTSRVDNQTSQSVIFTQWASIVTSLPLCVFVYLHVWHPCRYLV